MLTGRRIALIEDDEIMGGSIAQRLGLEGAEVVWLKLAQRAIGALRTPRAPIDAVVCDIRLPDGTGEEVFTTLCRTITPPPFLFITGQGDIQQAVRLLQSGAADYITKPFEMAPFLQRLVLLLRPRGAVADDLLGISPAARRIEELAATAALTDRPVLVRGGPGTGKALVARRIHAASDRAAAPFVHVNLAREADALAAIMEGAAQVGEGVLFLNGLERLPGAAQSWLMGWLDGRPAARIIAACGLDIAAAVEAGAFRGDLYFRLDLFEIPIPPLRDRPDDSLWLLHRLFEALNARREPPLRGISALAEQAVRGHDWPGNGRELRARLVQAMTTAEGEMLFPADLFPERQTAAEGDLPSLSQARDTAERAHILAALERTGGQVAEAAKLLQVSRTTLWEKMQKLGL
ncbi:response regulator [Frigidibacter albus]|uniref:Response regulator n=1 Tax=Frigidibacter albus TaxID=1465486 RepID=A0A6L8VIX3_9RHOB|nr:sigma 54-interacting transcriptional regulator [Frigidibacter albus]MZQ89502.1 response regulator [Frigidibacter albus]NBE31408.1 response regulator [Frigidibacter albus]GGH55614.1 sigma-54-dependent Fis family transcriptional regulator [Frigidibacter albus]